MGKKSIDEILKANASDFDDKPLIKALLLDRQGQWKESHEIAQEEKNAAGHLLHAYLHRKEGDIPNADYWYQKANTHRPNCTLEEEWMLILKQFAK